MDITEALAPASDQLDAIELTQPRTFTIGTGSALGKRDGKTVAEIRFENFDRVWRPSKGMLDVLAACWGTDVREWVGRRVTVYNDPEVMFGKDKVGGVRISHLSHIDKPRSITIRASGAGRKKAWPVQPLKDSPRSESGARGATKAAPTEAEIAASTDRDQLAAWWGIASPDMQKLIEARAAELKAQA